MRLQNREKITYDDESDAHPEAKNSEDGIKTTSYFEELLNP